MPELPEVETTIRDLRKKVLGRTFVDVWTDFEKMIKKPKSFKDFRKLILGKKIKNIRRRAKFILIGLDNNRTLLIHQKMTGHLLLGKWKKKEDKWVTSLSPLSEKINSYIHLVFFLDNGKMLALSDLRKFARVELWDTEELNNSKEIKELGPEPLAEGFSFEEFEERVKGKRRKIKQVLMDQKVIAGIGNIYSDEILFEAKIHPFKVASELSILELRRVYKNISKVLNKAIRLRGTSISDWRALKGEKGNFERSCRVYQREGEKCYLCGGKIVRKKIGGRSAHYCPQCQKLNK